MHVEKRFRRAAAPTAVALTLGFLAGLPAASATPHTQAPAKAASRPDPGFTPAERQAAVAQASSDSARTARKLKLGSKEALVVKDVARDTDGTEHVRYERTYAGLPVIGGDLVVHQSSGRSVRSVDWAHPSRVQVSSVKPSVARVAAMGDAEAATPAKHDDAASARKVVFAADHKPVLAWETRVTGTAKDGTPIDDLVYTSARTGKVLAIDSQVETDTGTGNSLYSGTVSVTTTPGVRAGTSPTAAAAVTRPTTPPASSARPTTAPGRCSPMPTTSGAPARRRASRARRSTRRTAQP